MNIGDLIFCRDKKDMLQKMYDCQEKGYRDGILL